MQFIREIQRLSLALMVIFAAISLTAMYWATIGTERILEREDNPRNVEQRAAIQRGRIVDRDGRLLASSVQESNVVRRTYYDHAMNSALGYFSLRYGTGGVEAAFDEILNGDNLDQTINTFFEEEILHKPQQGSDIRLSLDLEIQRLLAERLQNQRGAAVVLSIPTGEVLAMVSIPTFNPNALDTEWNTLIESPGNPFFNRVLQGQYQPGGTILTLLTTIALIEGFQTTQVFENGDQPVIFEEITLNCVQQPPSSSITLAQAYQYGCPAPFVQIVEQVGLARVRQMFLLFGLQNPPTLAGFLPLGEETLPMSPTPSGDLESFTLETALGQGSITMTPLGMAVLAGSYINAGNAPLPQILQAVRYPESNDWVPVSTTHPTLPVTTQQTAQRIQALMIESVNNGNAQAAFRTDLTIGGQTALAYSGEETQAWFIGFIRTDTREGITVAIVLEDSKDLEYVASIAGDVFQKAVEVGLP